MPPAHRQSVLVIGATGRTGLECIHHFANHQAKPAVHAFCRDADDLDNKDKTLCTSIVQGDAFSPKDLERALAETRAEVVVLSIGHCESVKKSYIRTASAQALTQVLKMPQFKRVRIIMVSNTGARKSRIIVCGGLGMLTSFRLRHVLANQTGQEHPLNSLRNLTTVVRATPLTGKDSTGKLVFTQDREKPPTVKVDRADLAAWIVKEVCGGIKPVCGEIKPLCAGLKPVCGGIEPICSGIEPLNRKKSLYRECMPNVPHSSSARIEKRSRRHWSLASLMRSVGELELEFPPREKERELQQQFRVLAWDP
jgi:putative NADH-flavin reductase